MSEFGQVEVAPVGGDRDHRSDQLLEVALELAGEHDLDHILERVVRGAADIADARYGALGIYGNDGRIDRFIHHGLDSTVVERIGPLPEGRGLLGELIVGQGPIRLRDLTADPRSCGFPAGHPPMRSFLGVPVRRGERRIGNLYLTEKRGGREFDADDEHFVEVMAAFAAAAVESVLLVATEEQARAARDLLARVIGAQEAERARVSRDLHDQIGQSLTSVLLGQRLVLDALDDDAASRDDVRTRAEAVRVLAADALNDARRLAFELRPIVLDDIGLVAALRRLTSDLADGHQLDIAVDLDGLTDDTRLPADIETVVYRVVQEALTNVTRHARATAVRVSVAVSPKELCAEIVDDGDGFDLKDDQHNRSLGLMGMAERAALVNGVVEMLSQPGQGTTVRLGVPVG